MLCDICKLALEKSIINLSLPESSSEGSESSNHSLHILKDSALNGCVVCKWVWQNVGIPKADSRFGDALRHFQITYRTVFGGKRHNQLKGEGSVDITVGSELTIRSFFGLLEFTHYPVQIDPTIPQIETRSTSTADAENLWRYWFRTCSESHKSCRGEESGLQPFLPIRLVEILRSDGVLYWRLVCNFDIKVTKYMTLSHCWGESQHTKLLRDNIACFKEKQLVSNLPKTYRDAMTVALSLKVQHIWIDSLCIIQDDHDDWKGQSSSMGLIYQNACCNIAATWGVDGTDGCFSRRERHTMPNKGIKVTVNGDNGLKEYVVYDKHAYTSEITNAPLNKRGWVTQERHLARKQLSFAKSQVYWECPELSASEDFPEGIPKGMEGLHQKKLMSTKRVGSSLIEEIEIRNTWAHLVEYYSECKLKRLSDKSAALAGLAGYMKTATNGTYLAGLWKKDLERQLLWRRMPSQRCCSGSPSYIAPTWSWMCLDAPVQYDSRYTLNPVVFIRWEIPYLAEILEVSVEPFNAMHSFRSAEVKLRGIAIQATVISTEPSEDSGSCVSWCTLQLADEVGTSQRRPIMTGIFWDRSVVSEQNLLFMFISTARTTFLGDVDGLVLKELHENELMYHRLGVFRTLVPYSFSRVREIDLSHIIGERLDVKNSRANYNGSTSVAQEYLNLDDERLKGLVHTVTIV